MTEDFASSHTYELDADRWILVEITRRWPKYVAGWSIRQRSGETDYPLASGEVECMPPRQGEDLEVALDQLRQEARQRAMGHYSPEPQEPSDNKGIIGRLFGR